MGSTATEALDRTDAARPPSQADVRKPLTPTRAIALNAAVAVAYVLAATAGFRLAFVAEQITTVWAPTGIALAVMLIGGLRFAPAIWLGALIANLGSAAPVWTACVIATGNCLEAVAAVYWLRTLPRFEIGFRRIADVLAFILVAALLCTAISATVGVATLCAAGVQPWSRVPVLWLDWWLGDALGAVVVAPAILTAWSYRWSKAEALRVLMWASAAAGVTHIAFGRVLGVAPHPIEYVIFPLVIGAAVSGGPRLTAWTVLTASAVAIWHTVNGAGPFASGDVHYSLLLLQTFMGVLAGTSLLLGAAVAERQATEQREREAAASLRRRQQLLRLAQRAGGVATFEWDFRNQVARCSAEFFHLFGLSAEDGVMTGAEWGNFVHPEDRERIGAHLARALEGSEAPAADYRINAADGVTRWLSYAGQIQRTPDGDRMLGTVVDITDRKRLEAELRHHASEVERILESIGEGFVAFDRDFRYVYVNPPAAAMLGRAREELVGRTPWEVFPEEATKDSRRMLEAALVSGVPTQFEIHIQAWDRWFETRVYPSAVGLTLFFGDITARKKAEAALRQSRDVLTLAMRGGSMGAWSRNLVTNEVWWSRELEELLGLDPGAFNRTEAGFFEFVHEEDRGHVRAAVDHAVQNGTDYTVEFRFRHAKGEWRWMEGRGRAVYADDGTPLHLYGLGIDVTERKRAELALREAKAAAESANQLKDQFLATLSHELRTPLNAILGYACMLRMNSIAPEKRQRAIEVIERNAVAQNRLIEDLLDMSRITTGRVRLDPTAIPVVSVLREALEGIKPAADAKRITLDVDFDPFAGSVMADATRLQQVFWNLLTNAVKFTPEGGRVAVSLRPTRTNVEIVISDSGRGISSAFLPFVFEPFRQGESRFDRAHGGLGLGLAITKQLVELHGGTIQASSPGVHQGATFTVTLPSVSEPHAALDGTPRVSSTARHTPDAAVGRSLVGLKVLVVDDEPDTLEMFRDALEASGAEVRAAPEAREALSVAERWPPDLIVTDLGLPGMDGYELLAAIRKTLPAAICPAIAVSAYARLDDRSRALAAGFQAHVAKPIEPPALVSIIVSALSTSD